MFFIIFAEAGMCSIHSAALVSEYLSMLESQTHLPGEQILNFRKRIINIIYYCSWCSGF